MLVVTFKDLIRENSRGFKIDEEGSASLDGDAEDIFRPPLVGYLEQEVGRQVRQLPVWGSEGLELLDGQHLPCWSHCRYSGKILLL